jgi:hypothetical protein
MEPNAMGERLNLAISGGIVRVANNRLTLACAHVCSFHGRRRRRNGFGEDAGLRADPCDDAGVGVRLDRSYRLYPAAGVKGLSGAPLQGKSSFSISERAAPLLIQPEW